MASRHRDHLATASNQVQATFWPCTSKKNHKFWNFILLKIIDISDHCNQSNKKNRKLFCELISALLPLQSLKKNGVKEPQEPIRQRPGEVGEWLKPPVC